MNVTFDPSRQDVQQGLDEFSNVENYDPWADGDNDLDKYNSCADYDVAPDSANTWTDRGEQALSTVADKAGAVLITSVLHDNNPSMTNHPEESADCTVHNAHNESVTVPQSGAHILDMNAYLAPLVNETPNVGSSTLYNDSHLLPVLQPTPPLTQPDSGRRGSDGRHSDVTNSLESTALTFRGQYLVPHSASRNNIPRPRFLKNRSALNSALNRRYHGWSAHSMLSVCQPKGPFLVELEGLPYSSVPIDTDNFKYDSSAVSICYHPPLSFNAPPTITIHKVFKGKCSFYPTGPLRGKCQASMSFIIYSLTGPEESRLVSLVEGACQEHCKTSAKGLPLLPADRPITYEHAHLWVKRNANVCSASGAQLETGWSDEAKQETCSQLVRRRFGYRRTPSTYYKSFRARITASSELAMSVMIDPSTVVAADVHNFRYDS